MPAQPKSKPKAKAQDKEIGVVSFDDFRKIDLRVARVVEAERVPKADKLLKLTTQVGDETRVIVAGVAEHYAPEELIGKRIMIVANPRSSRDLRH